MLSDSKFVPITSLVAIRNWINYFFGCQHCRDHFLRMTTRTFRMENQVGYSCNIISCSNEVYNVWDNFFKCSQDGFGLDRVLKC